MIHLVYRLCCLIAHYLCDDYFEQQYDFQLQQFRKLPNPSDKKPVEKDDDVSESSSTSESKTGRKISASDAVQLFQNLLEKEKVRISTSYVFSQWILTNLFTLFVTAVTE